MNRRAHTALLAGLFTLQLGIAPARAFLGFKLGSDSENNNDNPVSGSAGTEGAQGESPKLEKCDRPLGTLAVAEPQDFVAQSLMRYGLPSPTGLIRMMIQQSNCFMVVERGVAMQNLMQERRLAEGGQLRSNSNMGKGQMVTADYVLTPNVVFSEKNTGGIGGALGGLGLFGAAAGLVAAGLKFKEAQTSMLLADTRSSLQVAAAQGSAKKTDWSLGGLLIGGGAGGALGAYENTPEGKVVAASFLDNWNNIVRSVRNNPSLVRTDETLKTAAAKVAKAGDGMEAGDVLLAKIKGVKLYGDASKKARVIATLARDDELIYTGQDKDGFISVQSGEGEGWVEKVLVRKP
jgi:curli biogenesis system outer membrane secretion channel CsgG